MIAIVIVVVCESVNLNAKVKVWKSEKRKRSGYYGEEEKWSESWFESYSVSWQMKERMKKKNIRIGEDGFGACERYRQKDAGSIYHEVRRRRKQCLAIYDIVALISSWHFLDWILLLVLSYALFYSIYFYCTFYFPKYCIMKNMFLVPVQQ